MLMLAAAVFFIGFTGLAFVGISTARAGVRRLEDELDMMRSMNMAPAANADLQMGTEEDVDINRFSASLISLSTAHAQARHVAPEPVHDESSSLVSVRQPQ